MSKRYATLSSKFTPSEEIAEEVAKALIDFIASREEDDRIQVDYSVGNPSATTEQERNELKEYVRDALSDNGRDWSFDPDRHADGFETYGPAGYEYEDAVNALSKVVVNHVIIADNEIDYKDPRVGNNGKVPGQMLVLKKGDYVFSFDTAYGECRCHIRAMENVPICEPHALGLPSKYKYSKLYDGLERYGKNRGELPTPNLP